MERPLHCGPYRVLSCIGSGAMGTVHEAVDTTLGRMVALKRLHPHIAESPGASERFLREGRAAARIRHPHVVQVLALGNEGGAPFLAMERLDGHSLAAVLERCDRLSVAEALDHVLPVIAAVGAAHDAQVIHRDLKPSNVFVERGPGGQPWPKVVDFGVSAIVEGSGSSVATGSDGIVGTVAYLPPEQARGQSGGSFAGDQYALAVLLYECVTGERPFAGTSSFEVLDAILHARIVPPSRRAPDVPRGFDAIVARAMSRKPERRYPSVRAFGAALLPMASDRARSSWSTELERPSPEIRNDSEIRKRPARPARPAGKTVVAPAVTETVDSLRVVPPRVAASPEGRDTNVRSYDGVAFASRGDTVSILWKAPARPLRARWLFDQMDRAAADSPEGLLTLMVILPTSAPPDRTTAVESAVRLFHLRAVTRKTAVIIVGDSVWRSLAKGVLRVLSPTLDASALVFVSGIDKAIATLMTAAGPRTPKAAELARDVNALYAALDPTLANGA
jgi:serine/threonine protein kinase